MVTAGVYLLIRSSFLLEYSGIVLPMILWIGSITALYSSLIGLYQFDIKRIIAYSTASQLGYMMVAIGLSQYPLALAHLLNHAFFKACLFLSAGSLIHSENDHQRLTKYGGMGNITNMNMQAIGLASLALIAFPFTTGFYSKELIITMNRIPSIHPLIPFNLNVEMYLSFIYYLLTITGVITALYSIKILWLTFFSAVLSGWRFNLKTMDENSKSVITILTLLILLSIFMGYLCSDGYIGLGSGFMQNSIWMDLSNEKQLNTEFAVNCFYKNLTLIIIGFIMVVMILYLWMGYSNSKTKWMKWNWMNELGVKPTIFAPNHQIVLINYKVRRKPLWIGNIIMVRYFNRRFWYDYLLNHYLIGPVIVYGYKYNKYLDRGILEWLGPYGINQWLNLFSPMVKSWDFNGSIVWYGLSLFLALILSWGLLLIGQIWSDLIPALTGLNVESYSFEFEYLVILSLISWVWLSVNSK